VISRRAFASLLASAASPLPPLLNHFYATVSPQTYAAIEASSFLRDTFAPFEKRTTVRNDSTYSGFYFYGQQTYFEFFEENQGDRKPGDAGLALALESASGSATLRASWQQLRPSLTTMVTRQLDGQAVDWFEMTSFEETRAISAVEGLRLFAMQYAPGFAQRWHPAGPTSIARNAILAAYCAKLQLTRQRESCLLQDVSHIEIAAPEPGVRLRAAQLQAAGWKLKPASGSIDCLGFKSSIRFRFAPKPIGVTRIEFSLQRNHPRGETSIGSTLLSFNGRRRAVWLLRP
jgi:hypothetical protein